VCVCAFIKVVAADSSCVVCLMAAVRWGLHVVVYVCVCECVCESVCVERVREERMCVFLCRESVCVENVCIFVCVCV